MSKKDIYWGFILILIALYIHILDKIRKSLPESVNSLGWLAFSLVVFSPFSIKNAPYVSNIHLL